MESSCTFSGKTEYMAWCLERQNCGKIIDLSLGNKPNRITGIMRLGESKIDIYSYTIADGLSKEASKKKQK